MIGNGTPMRNDAILPSSFAGPGFWEAVKEDVFVLLVGDGECGPLPVVSVFALTYVVPFRHTSPNKSLAGQIRILKL